MLTVNVESDFEPEVLNRAIVQLERAVELEPRKTRYRKTLAEAFLAARQFEKAVDHLLTVFEDRPEPRVAYLTAYAYYRLGHLPSAEKYLAKAAESSGLGFARLHVLRGRILYDKRLWGEAVNEFSDALVLNPNAPIPRWHLARALVAFASQEQQDTLNIYRRALTLLMNYEPTREQEDEWHQTLGRVHLALFQPVEALQNLEKSRQADGEEKTLLVGLATLLMGSPDQALPYLEQAARNVELRPRVIDYLVEIAATPAKHLQNQTTGAALDPAKIDDAFIRTVFGADSPDLEKILATVHDTERRQQARTRVELTAPLVSGRLFAERDEQPAEDDVDPTVTDIEGVGPDGAAPPGDRIFPQTMLDLSDVVKEITSEVRRSAGPRDDWDESLDEAVSEMDDGPKKSGPDPTTKLKATDLEQQGDEPDDDAPEERA